MKIIKNIGLLAVLLMTSYFLAKYFGRLYDKMVPLSGGSFIGSKGDAIYLIGLPLSYIFFLTLLFTAFGGAKKYWIIGVLLIPAVIFEFYFDLAHFYIPVALALLGWLIGWGITKLIKGRKVYA